MDSPSTTAGIAVSGTHSRTSSAAARRSIPRSSRRARTAEPTRQAPITFTLSIIVAPGARADPGQVQCNRAPERDDKLRVDADLRVRVHAVRVALRGARPERTAAGLPGRRRLGAPQP